MNAKFPGSLLLSGLAVVGLCFVATVAAQTTAPPRLKPAQLEPVTLGQAKPAHRFGDIYLAGQPAAEDLPQLQAAGMRTIINLRHRREIPWDQAAAVRQAGMRYVHVPFSGAAELTPAVFDKVLGVLADPERGPTLLHCATANRVGALWYAHRVLSDRLDPAAAAQEAVEVGLRDQGYLTQARAYVAAVESQRQQAPAANP